MSRDGPGGVSRLGLEALLGVVGEGGVSRRVAVELHRAQQFGDRTRYQGDGQRGVGVEALADLGQLDRKSVV